MVVPALVLIYSAIDSVSWLASDIEDQPVGEAFQIWVEEWMIKKSDIHCTAEELYAARCGLLHTLTPNSRLTEKKGVRRISYAWGTAKQSDLEESIKLLNYPGLVAVKVDDLFLSFKSGFADYLEMLESNPTKNIVFEKKASKHFVVTDTSTISEFLAVVKEAETNSDPNKQSFHRSNRHRHVRKAH